MGCVSTTARFDFNALMSGPHAASSVPTKSLAAAAPRPAAQLATTYKTTSIRHRHAPWIRSQAHGEHVCLVAATRQEGTSQPAIWGELPSYGGACVICGGMHWLPCTDDAVSAMQDVLDLICRHNRLDYDSSGAPDPRFALEYLFTKGPGRMLGVLLARDHQGQLHTLKAFSGQITESWLCPGWVGPVAGVINESPVYVKTRRVIEAMSARMHQLDAQHQTPAQTPGSSLQGRDSCTRGISSSFRQQQRQLLKRRRRCLSHSLLQKIQHSYATTTVGGSRQLSLLEVYAAYRERYEPDLPVTRAGQNFIGMPAGVGDCCAPKLLHAAAQQGLLPVALCEVWFGSRPRPSRAKQGRSIPSTGLDPNSSRQHCRLYAPCDKCRAILGTMLCTISRE